jgi:hypothetical protein
MSGWIEQWYGKDPGAENEIAVEVALGDTDFVSQFAGGSAVAVWATVVEFAQVTVDPMVTLMDGG